MKDLKVLADNNGYDYVTTTSEANGYPRNLMTAICGFDNFEQADAFATENGLTLISLFRKEGRDLWCREGRAYQDYEMCADDYGCDCVQLGECTPEEFFELACRSELFDLPEAYSSLQDLSEFIARKNEISDAIDRLKDGEFVVMKDGRYFETVKQHVMSYFIKSDSKHRMIAAVDYNIDSDPEEDDEQEEEDK